MLAFWSLFVFYSDVRHADIILFFPGPRANSIQSCRAETRVHYLLVIRYGSFAFPGHGAVDVLTDNRHVGGQQTDIGKTFLTHNSSNVGLFGDIASFLNTFQCNDIPLWLDQCELAVQLQVDGVEGSELCLWFKDGRNVRRSIIRML